MPRKESEAARRARLAKNQQPTGTSIVGRYLRRSSAGVYSAHFPKHFGPISKGPITLDGLERFAELAPAIAHGYVLRGLGMESSTARYNSWGNLKRGLLRFLEEHGRKLDTRIEDIDETLLRAFKSWLDDPASTGFVKGEPTRNTYLQSAQRLLRALLADKQWAPRLSPELKLIREAYPKSTQASKPTDILDDPTLERLYVAAAADCAATMVRAVAEQVELDAALADRVPVERAGESAAMCAAWLLQNHVQPFRPHWTLAARSKRYARHVEPETYRAAQRLLYPTLDELLPFVLLLALMFAFNVGVVLNMTHDDYEEETLFGRERIRLKPFKPRANRNQISLVLATDDPDNPRTIFRHLKERCERLREIIRPEFKDRVFVRFSRKFNRAVALEQSDLPMREAIARFCERHGLDPFQLKQIRPTTLDLVHEISGGNLLAMQQVANHEDPNTTLEHYTSAAFQRRNEEQLAAGMLQLERKYRTEGRVDAAARHRLRTDLGSATPGFACLDPFDSPQKGEKRGRLCQAYGRCPACELAMIDPTSPHAYAYLIKLRKALDEAAGRLGAPWLTRWGPVKERLATHWARLFTDEEVVRRGVTLATHTIPDLPQLD